MATKTYLSLERLTEYDKLIKGLINSSDESTLSSANSYTDTKVSNITSGTIVVKEAEHADAADEATHATNADNATTADSATKATQDGNGKVISSTYETKTDASAKLTEAKAYTDTVASGKADTGHNHDDKYDAKNSASSALASAKAYSDTNLETAKGYTDTKVAGMATTTVVDNKISAHNSSNAAHSDIRDLISALSTKVNNFLDVDDTTTDQLSEVLAMIEANEGTIESLTSNKVNVSDIVDNLTTSNASKVLSAKQGVALKGLIDALQTAVDGKAAETHSHAISDVTNLQSSLDAKAAQTSLDTHTGNTTVHITADERTKWNAAKSHADSAHAPSNAQENVIESIKVNGTAQTITSKAVNITVPTKASDIGAAESSHGHSISEITDLQTTLTNASNAIVANTNSINAHTDRLVSLENKVGDGFTEITSAEIQNLFK